jgi:hypothetical protein
MNETSEYHKTEGDERIFKLLDFLINRLDHTLTHTQTSTKHIYLVNGAILAAAYFTFDREWPLWVSFSVTAALSAPLCIVNWLHANFLNVQNAWYRAIDEKIRKVFLKFHNFDEVRPDHLGVARDRVLRAMNRCPKVLRFRHTHAVYVWIHLVLSMFLLFVTVVCIVLASYWKTNDAG